MEPVRARPHDEGGFTIVETMVALMLIFGALTAALTLLSTSVKGVVTGQQRSAATSIAREMLERARGAEYSTIGHDFDDDTTLNPTADPALSGSPLTYNGEVLAGSSVDKDTSSPFYPHLRTRQVGNVTYTIWAYATAVPVAQGDPFKRATVVVRWSEDQYDGAVDDTVRVESLIYDTLEPPDPLLLGMAEVDAGAIRILPDPQPFIVDHRVASATLFLPFSRGEIESRFVRTARAFARTARTELAVIEDAGLTATPQPPCVKETSGASATGTCPGVTAEVIADNDGGSAPPPSASVSTSVGAGELYRGDGSAVRVLLGTTNNAASEATVDHPLDGLPYAKGTASGPASFSMPFTLGTSSGSYATLGGAVSTAGAVDRNGSGGASTISASGSVSHPAIDLLTFTTSPLNEVLNADGSRDVFTGYSGMVKVGATSVAIENAAGPGAAGLTFTPGTVSVAMFTTDPVDGKGSYSTVSITPGTAATAVTTARFLVESELVTVTATMEATNRVTESTATGSTTYRATTKLASWLKVRLDVTVGSAADFSYEIDYGRITVDSTYEDPA